MRKFALLFLVVGFALSTLLVFAATFDYDLLPNFTNSFDIGFSPATRWKNFNIAGTFYGGSHVSVGTTTIGEIFRVATSSFMFGVDSNGNTKIGSNLLYIPVFSSDPSGVGNGAFYYQSQGSNQKFRAFEGGLWKDVIGQAAQLFWDDQGSNTWSVNAGNVGIGLTSGITEKLTVNGVVENQASGFIFPDGQNWKTGRNSVFSTSSNDTDLTTKGFFNRGSFFASSAANWALSGYALWSPRSYQTSVVFYNNMWVLGGLDNIGLKNDVWYSSDGVIWNKSLDNAPWNARAGHASIIFNNNMWVIGGVVGGGGYMSDVWKSTDSSGVLWNQVTTNALWSNRRDHASVVYNNFIWVMGGLDNVGRKNDAWYSSDGLTWTQAASSLRWTPRNTFSSVVYNNFMWVIGGNDGVNKNDVWYSSNGVLWTQAVVSAQWTARSGQTSFVYNNRMWVIGGQDNTTYKNDVWYSYDGITWTQVSSAVGWGGRWLHSSVVYNNKIWVMGGDNTAKRNDVWSAESKEIFLYNNF